LRWLHVKRELDAAAFRYSVMQITYLLAHRQRWI
jgi:hypothetical protein